VEFISQYLQLRHAHAHPDILDPNTHAALSNLKRAEVLDAATADGLIQALELWQALQGLLRLTVSIPERGEGGYAMPESLKRQVSRLADAPSVDAAEEKIRATAAWVMEQFERLIVTPANAARAHVENSDLNRAKGGRA